MFDEFAPPAPASGKKKKRAAIRFQRTNAKIRIETETPSITMKSEHEDEFYPARLMLNDFKPGSVCVFTTRKLNVKQTVSITIESPRQFYCKGQVVQVRHLGTDSNILIEGEPFRYRVGINFITSSDTEKKTILDYFNELQTNHLQISDAA